MNEQLTPNGSVVTHTFLLYSDDDILARQLDRSLAILGVVVSRGGPVDELMQEVGILAPNGVIVEFGDGRGARAHDAARQLRELYPEMAILGIGRANEANLRMAMRAGVEEFIDTANLTLASDIVREALFRHDVKPRFAGGPVIAVLGGRPGVGATSVAGTFAQLLRQRLPDDDVLLMDFGHPAQDACLYLGLEPELDVLAAVQNLQRFDKMMLESSFARHESGLAVLPLPQYASDRHEIGTADTLRLMRVLRAHFAAVVLDLGGSEDLAFTQHLVRTADRVLLVCDQGIGALRSTLQMLAGYEELGLSTAGWRLVVNRFESDRAVTPNHLAHRIGLPLAGILPADPVTLCDAQSFGRPVPGNSRFARALNGLLDKAVQDLSLHGGGRAANDESLGARLSRLFRNEAA
ncbi:AAA family ATPase [Chitiniphilus eburneus]|nr:hypothetical protein [Chitiniphilus eburneus]